MAALLVRCWDPLPDQRPTFDTVFNELRECRYEILQGVKREVVEEYVEKVLEFEGAHPAKRVVESK
jgi:hypothetical protein